MTENKRQERQGKIDAIRQFEMEREVAKVWASMSLGSGKY